ncbi:YbaB/EbfC family nucleoid-associated protein [Micromonospora chalcea]|uniref:YbaB/EbfC family nucleoid-associated protein n=1 Tax=Micromonospora chalcea TaxID=1874 RepID=UPI0037F98275
MASEREVSNLDGLLTEARRALQMVRSGGAGPAEPEAAQSTTGTGTAADGMVSATITDGRFDTLVIEPRLMRLPAAELAEHVTSAVNAALDDLRDRRRDSEQSADLDALAQSLRAVQDRSIRQMTQMSHALRDVVALLQEPRR